MKTIGNHFLIKLPRKDDKASNKKYLMSYNSKHLLAKEHAQKTTLAKQQASHNRLRNLSEMRKKLQNSAKQLKNMQIGKKKFRLITKNLQTTNKLTPWKPNVIPQVNKKFGSLSDMFFFTPRFIVLSKTAVWKK